MVFQAEGLNRIIALLKCLVAFSETTDCIILSSIGFNYNLSAAEHDRKNCIYNYIILFVILIKKFISTKLPILLILHQTLFADILN